MRPETKAAAAALKECFEKNLAASVPENVYPELSAPMNYALLGGGKRVRPVLTLLAGLSLGLPMDELMPFALALEQIHTYSLIHDDLPAMDNDDYRRGRLTVHKVYGEAQAILAGDALLNLAFETLAKELVRAAHDGRAEQAAKALEALSACSGGMVSGQSADLYFEQKKASLDELKYIEHYKTGCLLTAPFLIAASLKGLDGERTARLCEAGYALGSAFQIYDDVLDVEGSFEELGKPIHSDEESGKSTFVSCFGLEKAKEEARRLTETALAGLSLLPGFYGEALRDYAAALISRKN